MPEIADHSFPGPAALGRGVVVQADGALAGDLAGDLRAVVASWPRVVVDDVAFEHPAAVADELHALWAARQPVVVVLRTDPEQLRAAESSDAAPYELGPGFEFARERLQFLVWSNNYDLRGGEPIWWHGRRAQRLGATASATADVTLADGTPAWCDGGPRQPLGTGDGTAIVHREEIEAGGLRPDRVAEVVADLAPDQLAAVAHQVGPARVIAPAGSGKTRVLTERLRHLLADRRLTPSSVTAVAYNRRAADQLTERTAGLATHVRTLNSLGLAVVNGGGPFAAPATAARQVIEEYEVRRILEGLVQVRRQQNTDPYAAYIDALSAIRLGLTDPRIVEEVIPDAEGIAEIFGPYRAILAERGVLDFDEQIYGAIEVLLREPERRRTDQRIARHLLVDEFQDLTPAHLLLLRLLAAPTYDVFGVGDDDQVIYSYAGASPEFLIEYPRYFPGATAHALDTNYRCPVSVVAGARRLLAHNHRRLEKSILTPPERTEQPGELVVESRPSLEQATAVAARIAALVDAGSRHDEIAVLTRVNSALLPVQVTLAEAHIPADAPLARNVLQRTGIRTALAYLRIGADPRHIVRADVAETIRRPSRRIARNVTEMLQRRAVTSLDDIRGLAAALSGGDVDKLARYADDLEDVARAVASGSTADALRTIRDSVGLANAMDALDLSRREADRSTHLDDLAALEQVAALHPDPSTFEPWLNEVLGREGARDGVTLSTVHRVKGREWPHVIVAGVSGSAFPHRLASDIEEERRVFHVAITRGARDVVVIADAEDPSPFCAELLGEVPVGSSAAVAAPRRRAGEASATTDRERAKTKRQAAPAKTLEAVPGLRVRIRGGIDAEVVELTAAGVVVSPSGGSGRLVVAPDEDVVVEGVTVRLRRPGEPAPEIAMAALREWRSATAARDKVPAYVVFSDAHLEGIASALPKSLNELASCRGIGPAKLEKYGDELLAVLEGVTATAS